jgi:DNA-binding helix-hairpin-helix protein with protein kinase domain
MAVVTLLPGARNVPAQLEIDDKPDKRGGEAVIHFTRDRKYAVKLYHCASPDKPRLLQYILQLGSNLGEAEKHLAWPLGVVSHVDGKARVGCVTRFVPYKPLCELMLSPRDAQAQFQRGRSWMDYLKIARGLTDPVRSINGMGMAQADIHWKNFLADPATGEVVLIDLDGLVVKGFLPPQVDGVRGFIAPEVEMGRDKPNERTDRHSAAVVILWTLLFRNVMEAKKCYDDEDEKNDDRLGYGQYACFSEHPDDRRNAVARVGTPLFRGGALSYRSLSPRLQELTEHAFILGLKDPAKRPQVQAWERALAESYDLLIVCSGCRQSFTYPYWITPAPRRQCPFCGAGVRAPFPAVLELQEPRARDAYVPSRNLVLCNGQPLFADAIEPGTVPPFTRRDVPRIGKAAWDEAASAYRLHNLGDAPWQILNESAESVGNGGSVLLRRGLVLSFGPGKRLARVVE